MNWYLEVLRKYAVFKGRSRRKEYWYFILFSILISIVLAVIDTVTGTFSAEYRMGLLGSIYLLAILMPYIAVTVRRLHDQNGTGWWMLFFLVPFYGPIALVVLMLQDSNSGENRYGLNPKGA